MESGWLAGWLVDVVCAEEWMMRVVSGRVGEGWGDGFK